MLGLESSQQSFFVGIRSLFYRLAMISGQGLLIVLAGLLEKSTGNIRLSWSIIFFILAGLFGLFFVYHRFVLPRPGSDGGKAGVSAKEILKEFGETFVSFFTKKGILLALLFMQVYRLGEAMLVKWHPRFCSMAAMLGGLD